MAVKVVSPTARAPRSSAAFATSRRILAALEHPGIARFHDAGRDADGRWFLALEYVEGADLIDARARRSALDRGAAPLFSPCSKPVAYAHARGVVHRDLKPANILVSPTAGRVCSTSASPSCSIPAPAAPRTAT